MNTGFVFDRIKNATTKAFDRVGKVADIPTDPELKVYKDLTHVDFDNLSKKFGADNVMKYIQAMEAKSLGALNSGGQDAKR